MDATDRADLVSGWEIGEQTFYGWRIKYGALEEDEAQRLKALEQENSRLNKIDAEQALDISMLRDLRRGNWRARRVAWRVRRAKSLPPAAVWSRRSAMRPPDARLKADSCSARRSSCSSSAGSPEDGRSASTPGS